MKWGGAVQRCAAGVLHTKTLVQFSPSLTHNSGSVFFFFFFETKDKTGFFFLKKIRVKNTETFLIPDK